MNTTQHRVIHLINRQGGFIQSVISTNTLEIDLGIDPLDRVEIMMALEEEFGIDIVEDEFDELHTVQQVIGYVDGIIRSDASLIKTSLIAAEQFIAGFEDDADQPGIEDLLANLRKAIAHVHVRERYIAALNKAGLDCAMELDWVKNEYPVPEEKRDTLQQIVERFHATSAEVMA